MPGLEFKAGNPNQMLPSSFARLFRNLLNDTVVGTPIFWTKF